MRLWCQECGWPSGPEARGWRLYLTTDHDEDDEYDEPLLAAYCPACAVREFGESRREQRESG